MIYFENIQHENIFYFEEVKSSKERVCVSILLAISYCTNCSLLQLLHIANFEPPGEYGKLHIWQNKRCIHKLQNTSRQKSPQVLESIILPHVFVISHWDTDINLMYSELEIPIPCNNFINIRQNYADDLFEVHFIYFFLVWSGIYSINSQISSWELLKYHKHTPGYS